MGGMTSKGPVDLSGMDRSFFEALSPEASVLHGGGASTDWGCRLRSARPDRTLLQPDRTLLRNGHGRCTPNLWTLSAAGSSRFPHQENVGVAFQFRSQVAQRSGG